MYFLAALILAAGAEPTVFELTAERVVHDGAKRRAYAEGNAELTTSNAAIHAERITWDRDTQAATAIGRVAVRLTDGELLIVVADVVTVRFGEGDTVSEVFVNDGRVYGKKGVTAAQLRAVTDPDALKAMGETTMRLTANHLVREGKNWRLEALELVPCECDFEKPSWSIRSSDSTIDPVDDRGSLWSPVVRIHGVPVLWLPWISLPLSNRQTGLLAPKPGFTALNGFAIEQPVYVTLGRSADLTLTPGFFAGNGAPVGYGVWGPRLLTEFRYAPNAGTTGRASLGLLWDLKPRRSVSNPFRQLDGQRGLRAEGAWQHAQKLSAEWETRIDASFFSDAYYQRDLVSDVLAREAGYLRSTAAIFHRGPDHWAGLDVALRQDLNYGYPLFGKTAALAPDPAYGPNPLDRLPALTWALPPRPVLGPLAFGLLADFVRLAPIVGPSGDEGSLANEGRPDGVSLECLRQRLYTVGGTTPSCNAANETGQGDGQWQPGEREPRERLQVMPKLSVAQPLPFATLTASAAWRQGVWLGEQSGRATQRGHPVLSARADSELARRFGNGVRHAISPALEVRGVPFVIGDDPAPYDEVDVAITGRSQWQAIAEVRQRITRGGAELLRLDVGQGVQLSGTGPALGESYGALATGIGWFTTAAKARLDPNTLTVTKVEATASISDGQGHGAYAAYENLIHGGTDRMRRPIDLLFAPTVASGPFPGRAQMVVAGAAWRFGAFGLRYDAVLLDRLERLDLEDPALKPKVVLYLAQHSVGASYAPACDCFRLEVMAIQRGLPVAAPGRGLMYGLPDFAATLTISRFGSFGVSR